MTGTLRVGTRGSPLALAQTVGGFLAAALAPASAIHNMRVGTGYLFYGLR